MPLSDKLPNTINVSIPIQPVSRTSSKVVSDVTEGRVTPIAKEKNNNVVLNKMGTISKKCSKGNADEIMIEKNASHKPLATLTRTVNKKVRTSLVMIGIMIVGLLMITIVATVIPIVPIKKGTTVILSTIALIIINTIVIIPV